MNLKEAREKATPGPLIVQGIEDKRTSTDATLTAFTPKFGCPRYVARVYGQGVFSNMCDERDANAALLAHCFNHFDEVVDALDELIGAIENQYETEYVLRFRKILASAKEVEGI